MLGRSECRFCGECMPHTDLVCWGCSRDRFRELRKSSEVRDYAPAAVVECSTPVSVRTGNAVPRWLVAAALAASVFLGGYWLGKGTAPVEADSGPRPVFTGSQLRM